MSSSSGSSELQVSPRTEGITMSQMSGVSKQGVPCFIQELEQGVEAVNSGRRFNRSQCKWSTIVLGILGVIAAIGGTLLMVVSGGPGTPYLFYSGIVLEVVAAAFIIWITVQIALTIKKSHSNQAQLNDLKIKTLSNQEILDALEEDAVTVAQIRSAVSTFSREQQVNFITWVHNNYCPEDEEEEIVLEPGQKKVVEAFAAFPHALAEIELESVHRLFALELLKHLSPNVFTEDAEDASPHPLLALFAALGVPQSNEEYAIFAKHPEAAALTVKENLTTFDRKAILGIYSQMDWSQKGKFLTALNRFYEAQLENEEEDVDLTLLKNVITVCLNHTLTLEGAQHIGQNPVSEEAQALLRVLAKWPKVTAPLIFSVDNLLMEHPFINALNAAMSPEERGKFITSAVTTMNDDPQRPNWNLTVFRLARWIEHYASPRHEGGGEEGSSAPAAPQFTTAEGGCPPLLKKVSRKLPFLMAEVLQGSRRTSHGQAFIMQQIAKMSVENQVKCLKAQRPENFLAYFTLVLSGKARHPDRLEVIAAYFKSTPEADFRELVLENDGLGDVTQRGFFALEILERMGSRAERVIAHLDQKSKKGYPYFNFLTNLLVDQANGYTDAKKPKKSFEELVARFAYATTDQGQNRIEISRKTRTLPTTFKDFKNNPWKLKAHGSAWNNFYTFAQKHKSDVWKHRN